MLDLPVATGLTEIKETFREYEKTQNEKMANDTKVDK